MKCSLCGCEFDEQHEDVSCASCRIGKRCGLVRCPRCHYETPAESSRKIKSVRDDVDLPGSLTLEHWPIGVKGRIRRVETDDRGALRKLIAMGALPPTEILLHSRFPSYVLDIGNGRFTIDKELASRIFVKTA